MMNQKAFQSTPNKPQTITFPEGKPILAEANTSKQLAGILAKSPDLQLLYDSVAPVKNVKAAVEMVVYSLNYLSKINGITPMQNIMAGLFTYYKYEEFIGNELLNKYTIIKKSENIYTYKIRRESYDCNFKPKKIDNLDYKKNKFLEIQSTYHAIYAAIKNGNKQTVEELIKEVLKNAELHLTVFSASNYNKYTTIIAAVIELLEPESKVSAFRILKKHYQENFTVLANFSNALLIEKHFDEVIELLESKLVNIGTLANGDIGNCYYNLGLAYYTKADYQSAKKYYLSALRHLPNDQETISELIKIYLNTYEIESAENYIKSLQSKDIKNLLEMSLDLSTISTTKLKSVKNESIPEAFSSLIPNLEYIAKFNEGKFSNNDKITAFKTLCKKCNDNHVLLSTALYTKQYDFVKEIIQKIPKKKLFQNKYLWEFKALFGLEEDTETSQMVIDNNNLEGREAADLINISNTVSIANGEFDLVAEKVDNALKYDQKNEEALEIGIAFSLLNNNQEKAKEYADQLSEEKQQEVSANYSTDNKAENIEELIEQYDPKEI